MPRSLELLMAAPRLSICYSVQVVYISCSWRVQIVLFGVLVNTWVLSVADRLHATIWPWCCTSFPAPRLILSWPMSIDLAQGRRLKAATTADQTLVDALSSAQQCSAGCAVDFPKLPFMC